MSSAVDLPWRCTDPSLTIRSELGADKVAAYIAEPILASGGVIVPPPGYHKRCLDISQEHKSLPGEANSFMGLGICEEKVYNIEMAK